jgi:hypothetical protein
VGVGFAAGVVILLEYLNTGLVTKLPLAVFAVGAVLSGMLLATVGLILHTMANRFREINYKLRRMEEAAQYADGRGARESERDAR